MTHPRPAPSRRAASSSKRRSPRRSSCALAALLAALLAAPAALAAGPDDKTDPKFAARALAEHGYALYEAGKYQEAADILLEADKIYHAPTIVLALGRALAGAGKLVEAQGQLRRLVDEQLPPGAPPPFVEAQRAAKDELARIDKRVPTIQIAVRGGRGGDFAVRVDDAPVAPYSPDRVLPLNPGTHHVAVVPAADPPVTRDVTLAEGAQQRVEIELPVPAPPPVAPPPPPPSPPPPPRRGWLAPAIAAFGVGAAGLAVGVGAGVVAAGDASSIRKLCGGTDVCAPNSPTTPEARSELSSANGVAAASTVGFVLAAAGAATGVVLVIVKPWSRAPSTTAVAIGPGSITFRRAF